MDRIRATMLKAWAHLNGSDVRQRNDPPHAGRPRDPGVPMQVSETQPLGKPGFAEEALPWMEAVHRFPLRLTRNGRRRRGDPWGPMICFGAHRVEQGYKSLPSE